MDGFHLGRPTRSAVRRWEATRVVNGLSSHLFHLSLSLRLSVLPFGTPPFLFFGFFLGRRKSGTSRSNWDAPGPWNWKPRRRLPFLVPFFSFFFFVVLSSDSPSSSSSSSLSHPPPQLGSSCRSGGFYGVLARGFTGFFFFFYLVFAGFFLRPSSSYRIFRSSLVT